MLKFRIVSAALFVAAVIASPALAAGDEGGGPIGPGSRNGLTPQPGVTRHHVLAHRHGFRGAYNRWNGHYDPEFQRNREDFGFSGRDRSRVGGETPSVHPGD